MRVAAIIRHRWRATIVLVLLVGLGAGVAMATVAASRRTAAAYGQMVAEVRPPDLNISFCPPDVTEVDETVLFVCSTYQPVDERRVVAALAEVESAVVGTYHGVSVGGAGHQGARWAAAAFIMQDEGIRSIDGEPLLIEGRWPRADEAAVVVNDELAETAGLGVGDAIEVTFWSEDDAGATWREGLEFGGPTLTVPIVGRSRGLVDLAASTRAEGALGDDARLTGGPGLADATADAAGFVAMLVRSIDGDVRALGDAIEAAFPGRALLASPSLGEDERAPVRDAIGYEATGVLAIGALFGLTAAVICGQTVARQTRREWADRQLLSALGFTRVQTLSAVVVRALVVAVLALVVAVATTLVLSPFGPIGVARLARPHPGFGIDWVVVAVGTVVVLALVPLAAMSALRDGEPGGARGTREPRRSWTPGWLPLPWVVGVQMGRRQAGGSGVPILTAVSGASLAVATLAAAAGLTASLDALHQAPARYGAPWDLSFGGLADGDYEEILTMVAQTGSVRAGAGLVGTDVAINGQTMWVHAFHAFPGIDGRVRPPVLRGRAPEGADEIALGSISMTELGLSLGDQVEARSAVTGSAPSTLTVVGTAMINDVYEHSPGRGAIVTEEWLVQAAPEVSTDLYVVQMADGRDAGDLRQHLEERFAVRVDPPTPQVAIRNLDRIRDLPFVLAAAVSLLALAALAHALVLWVQRSRRDLAVLQSLGFTRRQVGAAISGHATALALAAAVVGVPLGIVLGRLGWQMIASRVGVVNLPVTPLAPILAVVLAVVLLANALAVLPARRAQRTAVATALRGE